MIKTIRVKDNNIVDYLGDNTDSITELTNNSTCAPGSTCYLVETGETYIKKLTGEWTAKLETKYGEPQLNIEFDLDSTNDGGLSVSGDFGTIKVGAGQKNTYNEKVKLPITRNIIVDEPKKHALIKITTYVDDKQVDDKAYNSVSGSIPDSVIILSNDLVSQYGITFASNVRIKVATAAVA